MTILGYTISMPFFWLLVAVIFAVIEGLTMGLTTLWFAGGALVALVVSFFTPNIFIQVGVFIVVSVVFLVSTRKVFIKKLRTGQERTNVDALIGKEAIAETDIKTFKPGIIKLNGQEWTAIPEDGTDEIEKGQKVTVIRIEGVKAVVHLLEEKEEI